MINKILLATTNQGKVAEFKTMLKGCEFLTLRDFPPTSPPREIGEEFEQNAKIKANFYFQHFNIPVIVEDSGFCVEKLGGMPGVHSAEWGENGDFTKGITRIYQMLNGESSNASFTSVIVFKNELKELIARGDIFGKTPPSPRGLNGFGFDSCFIPEGFAKTFAEMTIEEKSNLSHRKIALSNLIKML